MWNTLREALLPAVQDLVVWVILPVLGTYVAKLMRDKKINEDIVNALSRAAGAALLAAQQRGGDLKNPAILRSAVEAGVDYLKTTIPQRLAQRGIDDAGAALRVQAEIGRQVAAAAVAPAVPTVVLDNPLVGAAVNTLREAVQGSMPSEEARRP